VNVKEEMWAREGSVWGERTDKRSGDGKANRKRRIKKKSKKGK
jgi:hypothetical protein